MCVCVAEEEDFRHYCASLFAVPVSMGGPEPQVTTPESCLHIEVLDEVRITGVFYFKGLHLSDHMSTHDKQGKIKTKT